MVDHKNFEDRKFMKKLKEDGLIIDVNKINEGDLLKFQPEHMLEFEGSFANFSTVNDAINHLYVKEHFSNIKIPDTKTQILIDDIFLCVKKLDNERFIMLSFRDFRFIPFSLKIYNSFILLSLKIISTGA